MSLGLGDLKKKTRTAAKKFSNDAKPAPSEQHAWAGKTATARPWSDTTLGAASSTGPGGARGGQRRNSATGAVMNDDWMSLQAAPLFWLDLETYSRAAKLQQGLMKLERKVQTSIVEPLKTFKKFLSRS
jgi:hypothetical protein